MSKAETIFKNHLWKLVVGLLAVLTPILIETFKEGAEAKYEKAFLSMLQTEEAFVILDARADTVIQRTIKNPFVWIDILSSTHIEKYAQEKAIEVKEHVAEEIMKNDSINGSFLSKYAEAMGMREDKIFEFMVEMAKYYEKKQSRTVHAEF